jgi:hypothetical protein
MRIISNLFYRVGPVWMFVYVIVSVLTFIGCPFVAAYWAELGVIRTLWENLCCVLLPVWFVFSLCLLFIGIKE